MLRWENGVNSIPSAGRQALQLLASLRAGQPNDSFLPFSSLRIYSFPLFV
jgi:hypothetical protein